MKGVNHDNRLKSCSRSSGAGERFPASKPGEAKHRAVARANLCLKPRNAKMRVASASETMKPALSRQPTAWPRQALRGGEGQRDAKDRLGTWDPLRGACGVSRAQRAGMRINKHARRREEVGEAHSSDEAGESRWSEGALATGKRTQKWQELIGWRKVGLRQDTRPRRGGVTLLTPRAKLGCQAKRLGPTRRACLVEESPVGASRAVKLSAKAGQ